nr:hypothetical protein [Sicyoidochytrium minutum DNA virus]
MIRVWSFVPTTAPSSAVESANPEHASPFCCRKQCMPRFLSFGRK